MHTFQSKKAGEGPENLQRHELPPEAALAVQGQGLATRSETVSITKGCVFSSVPSTDCRTVSFLSRCLSCERTHERGHGVSHEHRTRIAG